MPNLYSDKSGCCGCGACVAICPKHCITMVRDDEGFDYPVIDSGKCIECGRCEAVCPWKHEPQLDGRQTPPDVHAAWSLDDEIRRQSSSGGVFSVLATHVLDQGGAVVGAAFTKDYHAVEHVIVEDQKGLARVRGSKYVQSEINPDLFRTIAEMIKHNRPVLFTGCPCQVAGLRLYLGDNQNTLFTCDLVCHGIPSPGWFDRYYTQMEIENSSEIASLSFRNKEFGWHWQNWQSQYAFRSGVVMTRHFLDDYYFSTFLHNYSLRYSCYKCKYAKPVRQGDMTLGDYWGVETRYPEYDQENKGTSLIVANSKKGERLLNSCSGALFVGKGDFEHASLQNPNLYASSSLSERRKAFLIDSARMPLSKLRIRHNPLKTSVLKRALRKLLNWARQHRFLKYGLR